MTSLGGYMTSLADDLEKTSIFLNGEQFFATYASAQEVANKTFQPSGTDYIIHVLGDNQRKNYLECFRQADFKYAATIKETFTYWEYWVQRANWFFYRELYQNWHPVYSNSYEMYWERNSETENNILTNVCSISMQDIDNATKKIIIKADSSINGIADVFIDYEVKKNNQKSSQWLFQSLLKVQNTGIIYADDSYFESNYLRSKSSEFIPIQLINGYGEVTITASPTASTYLIVNNINCSDVYTVTFDFVEMSKIVNEEERSIINVINNAKNQKCLENLKTITVGEKKYTPIDIQSDEKYLYITIPFDNEENSLNEDTFQYNNIAYIER